jgi:hypothetical protein
MLSLNIRKVKECYEPAFCTNNYLLSPPDDVSTVPTLTWKPTHSPRATVERYAVYPPSARIESKGDTASIRVSDHLCERMRMLSQR